MSHITINLSNNILIDAMGDSKTIDPQKSKKLQMLVEKHLPILEKKDVLEFHFNGTQLQVRHQGTTCAVEDFKALHEFINALHSLAPEESRLLEYNLHGIRNDSGHHCWAASAMQLAYNLFPDRIDSFFPRYEEIRSSTDFVQDFLDFQDIRDGEPQEVLSRIVDTSKDRVNITLKECRLSHTRMMRYYNADTISNTLVLTPQDTNDFTKLLKSTLQGPSDKETDTYFVSDFILKFPEVIPHLSFDLRNCAQLRSLDGRLERQHIANIPLHLDEQLLGVPCSLYLQGAILHIGGSDEKPGNHYVTIFQKKHPVTNEPQWFLADDSKVSTITSEQALELLPCSTYLYYEKAPTIIDVNTELDPNLKYHPDYKKAEELQHILRILRSLHIQEQEPKSWFEKLSDSFHGCDVLVELDDIITKNHLLDIHKKLLPDLPIPSSFASFEELSFLKRKLIAKATSDYKSLKANLDLFAHRSLEHQNPPVAAAQHYPSIFEKIVGFAGSWFKPTDLKR